MKRIFDRTRQLFSQNNFHLTIYKREKYWTKSTKFIEFGKKIFSFQNSGDFHVINFGVFVQIHLFKPNHSEIKIFTLQIWSIHSLVSVRMVLFYLLILLAATTSAVVSQFQGKYHKLYCRILF